VPVLELTPIYVVPTVAVTPKLLTLNVAAVPVVTMASMPIAVPLTGVTLVTTLLLLSNSSAARNVPPKLAPPATVNALDVVSANTILPVLNVP
jgi:hypothetical protein